MPRGRASRKHRPWRASVASQAQRVKLRRLALLQGRGLCPRLRSPASPRRSRPRARSPCAADRRTGPQASGTSRPAGYPRRACAMLLGRKQPRWHTVARLFTPVNRSSGLERIWAGVLDRLTESMGAEDVGKLIRQRARSQPWVGAAFDGRYTFATFVVGASNQFANAAARAVASQPGDHYNPLFIYGGVGLGKTHLVNAIGQHILVRQPLLRVGYLSCEVFMNELISSLRRDRMEEFKRRFRQVDVLVLDDVQLLAGRERTQEEFFHTFNTLHER